MLRVYSFEIFEKLPSETLFSQIIDFSAAAWYNKDE